MISKKAVEEQLKRIGFNFRLWGRAEVNELGRILLDDEIIAECVNGEYANGFALLVATNHRVLLVDKKPMLYLTVEDLRFDMITEFNYSHRMMNATIRLYTPNKTLAFTSWNQARLRRLLEYTQQRVLEMRQQDHMSQQFQAAAAAQYAQLHAANYYQQTPNYAPNLAPGSERQPTQVQPQAPAPQPYAQQNPQYELSNTTQYVNEPALAAAAPVTTPDVFSPTPSAPAADQSTQPAQSNEPSQPQTQQTQPIAPLISRFAAKRTALGTYTRNKLPSFRRHHDRVDNATPAAQSGEIYPQGYNPGQPVTNFGLPYEY